MKLLTAGIVSMGLLCGSVYADTQATTQTTTGTTATTSTTMQTPTATTTTQTTTTGAAMQPTQTDGQTGKAAGEAFLAANKSKPGVITLPDGLQYKVIKAGTGTQPTDNDIVTVQYEGKLINGKVFDSSYKRGEATTFPVNGVIAGWVEALKLMKEGSTWELYIPPTLAYGPDGVPPTIGPNETLIFKVELLKVKKGS